MALVPSGGGPDPDPDAPCKATTIPWSEMFHSASVRRPKQQEEATPPPKTPLPTATARKKAAEDNVAGLSLEPTLYIAMVHAGLATAQLVLYGLYMLCFVVIFVVICFYEGILLLTNMYV